MNRDSGSRTFPIWLIADSSPARWQHRLVEPLDPRHPARHNIWTPILESIQNQVFSVAGTRIDTTNLYIRNAVHNPAEKPTYRQRDWSPNLTGQTRDLAKLIALHRPKLLLTFGAFAFEFTRRSLNQYPSQAVAHWTSKGLGCEFKHRVQAFDPDQFNLLPLLHVSIARGRFLESHRNFTGLHDGNYFDLAARDIADLLLAHQDKFLIWQ